MDSSASSEVDLNEVLHDATYDLDEIRFEEERGCLTIWFSQEDAESSELVCKRLLISKFKCGALRYKLVVSGVNGFRVFDPDGIGGGDVSTLTLSSEQLIVKGGMPTRLEVHGEKLTWTLEKENDPSCVYFTYRILGIYITRRRKLQYNPNGSAEGVAGEGE